MAPVLSIPAEPEAKHLHAHFLAMLPRIELHARIRFRHLKCQHSKEDAVAETVALCWHWFIRLMRPAKRSSGSMRAPSPAG